MSMDMNQLKDQDLEKVAGGITEEEAVERALKHVGLTKADVRRVRSHPDWEHGRQVYEIKFYQGGFEYEFDIDAESGKILKYEKDWD